MAWRPLAREIPLPLVLPVEPTLMPRPPRNCLPRSKVVWVAVAVACSEALATESGSPGAPALTCAGSVGSHWPGSAFAGAEVRAAVENSSAVTTAVIQASSNSRNRLWRIALRLIVIGLPLDVPDYIRRHAAGADGRDAHFQTDVGGLEHLTVAQIERHVLAAAWAVEDDVAATHLRRGDLAAHVVLRPRVVREFDAHPGERIQDQPGAVEAHDAGPRVDSLTRTRGVPTTPGVGHPEL